MTKTMSSNTEKKKTVTFSEIDDVMFINDTDTDIDTDTGDGTRIEPIFNLDLSQESRIGRRYTVSAMRDPSLREFEDEITGLSLKSSMKTANHPAKHCHTTAGTSFIGPSVSTRDGDTEGKAKRSRYLWEHLCGALRPAYSVEERHAMGDKLHDLDLVRSPGVPRDKWMTMNTGSNGDSAMYTRKFSETLECKTFERRVNGVESKIRSGNGVSFGEVDSLREEFNGLKDLYGAANGGGEAYHTMANVLIALAEAAEAN
ncbi:uncharacterized protein I303_100226 [Kwoniella dejecticola CBS 10117]|uniref:Uncharacterized protein n=1 Tax=Kwoniella dejecticola CBS 10117 TaxID=1296121 RepID=A0A1A6AEA8_9TREE|nr:uncharacterized protein I303_00228 [Kwoniella dejecticola CBS 10117]OBR88411.1 hypothetical protein I303_00228 [Kwoniella dejecticola CBS 10117]